MKKVAIGVALLSTLLVAAGCGTVATTKETGSGSTTTAAAVKKVVIGTGTQFPNICFIDDKGNLTGYDVELVKEIDKRLPDYEFEFKTMEFKNLLLSLETNKIDLIAHEMEVNEERQAKFLFNDVPYNIFPLKITVNQSNNDVKSIDDLKGKKLIVTATSNGAVLAEKWNQEHGNGINIVYTGASDDEKAQIKSGRVDATISTQFDVDFANKAIDAQLKTVGDALSDSKVYFILRKDETDLKKRVDEALTEIKKDGTLAKLSTQWLGRDYTVEN